jgi:hypothetical protein
MAGAASGERLDSGLIELATAGLMIPRVLATRGQEPDAKAVDAIDGAELDSNIAVIHYI